MRRAAEVFQADPWPRRSRHRWLNKLRGEWRNSTPLERIIRVWWWCICAVLGLGVGLGLVIMAAGIAAMVAG